jgi:hypothetical protein
MTNTAVAELATTTPSVGDQVHIYVRSTTNVRQGDRIVLERSRVLQRGLYRIVRENRHHDWTVTNVEFGGTFDVYRDDVELASA